MNGHLKHVKVLICGLLLQGTLLGGCASSSEGEEGEEGEEEGRGEATGQSALAITTEQLSCEGYDPALAGEMANAGLSCEGRDAAGDRTCAHQKKTAAGVPLFKPDGTPLKGVGHCYRHVKRHLVAAVGHPLPGKIQGGAYTRSAYMFTNWARENPAELKALGFKELWLLSNERPPKGSILVYQQGECGYNKEHGHIEVVVDDGRQACSDFCHPIRRGWAATKGEPPVACSPTVFIPVGTNAAEEGKFACDGGCVDPARFLSDPRHCGTCGNSCSAGQICEAGQCANAQCTPAETSAGMSQAPGGVCACPTSRPDPRGNFSISVLCTICLADGTCSLQCVYNTDNLCPPNP